MVMLQNIHTTSSAWKRKTTVNTKIIKNKILIRLVVINQTEIVKLASGIFFCIFCLFSGTSYLSEPTSTEAGTADKLFVSYFSELLAALWTSNWTLIFNANTRPVLFQNYSTPPLWFFEPCWL